MIKNKKTLTIPSGKEVEWQGGETWEQIFDRYGEDGWYLFETLSSDKDQWAFCVEGKLFAVVGIGSKSKEWSHLGGERDDPTLTKEKVERIFKLRAFQ